MADGLGFVLGMWDGSGTLQGLQLRFFLEVQDLKSLLRFRAKAS